MCEAALGRRLAPLLGELDIMWQSKKGFFLVIEGLDGSGKTEISHTLANVLQTVNRKSSSVKLTFEPHDPSCAGLFIRQVLTKKRKSNARTLALAFAANRADHIQRDIIPFLKEEHEIVVCDRYYLSSLVYQATDDMTIDEVMSVNSGVMQPDLTIFLNASDATCFQRMRERAEDKELFEVNLRKTREKYLTAIGFLRRRGDVVVEIDTNGSKNEVLNNVLDTLKEYGPKWLASQLLLPSGVAFESPLRVVTVNGTPTLDLFSFAQGLVNDLKLGWNIGEREFAELKSNVDQAVFHLQDAKVAAFFLDYLRILDYRILDEIPWSDAKALELEFTLPLGIVQKGIALFLTKPQNYTMITKKILDPYLAGLSDFVICLDFSSEEVAMKYYERDWVENKSRTSASIILLRRAQIRDMVLAISLAAIKDSFLQSVTAVPELNEMFNTKIETWGLQGVWKAALGEVLQQT